MNRLPEVETAAKILIVAVGIGLLATFVVVGVPQIVGADQSYVVLSGSMEPAMSPGDVVIVDEKPPADIEVGDTITFSDSAAAPTTHRVIDKTQDGGTYRFKTRGIANEDPDQGWVEGNQIVGAVVVVIPYIGHVVMLANTRLGAALFLIIPGVLLVLNEVWVIANEYRDSDSGEPEVMTDGK